MLNLQHVLAIGPPLVSKFDILYDLKLGEFLNQNSLQGRQVPCGGVFEVADNTGKPDPSVIPIGEYLVAEKGDCGRLCLALATCVSYSLTGYTPNYACAVYSSIEPSSNVVATANTTYYSLSKFIQKCWFFYAIWSFPIVLYYTFWNRFVLFFFWKFTFSWHNVIIY